MSTPSDAVTPPESSSLPPTPLDEDIGPLSLFQEINERRARVENAELLAHLRGL
ncbi:MAG TPA: hypothetical protein VIE16_08995 [Phenylobacterium sp.]|jgi:hypothetical protein